MDTQALKSMDMVHQMWMRSGGRVLSAGSQYDLGEGGKKSSAQADPLAVPFLQAVFFGERQCLSGRQMSNL